MNKLINRRHFITSVITQASIFVVGSSLIFSRKFPRDRSQEIILIRHIYFSDQTKFDHVHFKNKFDSTPFAKILSQLNNKMISDGGIILRRVYAFYHGMSIKMVFRNQGDFDYYRQELAAAYKYTYDPSCIVGLEVREKIIKA